MFSDLKVDVHRKNSSESSDSLTEIPSTSFGIIQNSERRSTMKTKSKSEDAPTTISSDTNKELCLMDEGDILSRSEERRDKFVDTDGIGLHRVNDSKKRIRSKLQRQTSLDSSGSDLKNFPVRRPVSSTHIHKPHHGSGFYHPNHLPSLATDMYLESHFSTKSELAIERYVATKKSPMRKDSNSTMSAIQLPTNSGPSTSSTTRQRRYSNVTPKIQQQLSSGIVSVRRIKSTALDKCCPQPSFSNLSPHPNSVETINRPLRNPPHAILPPPSKSLVRNQHLNFFPKGASGSIEPVYPIAEIVDEKSLNESFILTSESEDAEDDDASLDDDDDDDDDDDEDDDLDFVIKESVKEMKNLSSKTKSMSFTERKRQKRTPDSDSMNAAKKHSSELDIDRPRTQSTDSENEINNGSQSPLLDSRPRTTICSSSSLKKECDTQKPDGANELQPDNAAQRTPDDDEGAVGGMSRLPMNLPTANTKSEDSGCPSSDCEQASASSKDMLLTKNSKSKSERKWHDFNMDANNISVDVSETGENVTNEIKTSTTDDFQSEKPIKETSKSLGAIPKASFLRYEPNEDANNRTKQHLERENNSKSLSQASSANSLSGSCNSLNSMNRNVLQVVQQTEDGWVVQTASPNNPYLVAQRGELPPLLPIYNTRTENVFSVSRKPYLYLHQQRQYHPKLRSGRNRMQNSSIDTTASSRDEDDISMAGAAGGSGSIGVGSGWDVLDMKISERLSTLFFPELIENQTNSIQTAQRSNINRMGFGDSMFWGHCNLPAEKKTQPKRYYKFPIKCLKHEIKISMDRLQLLALFDRDYCTIQAIASIFVGVCCSILGAIVLQLDFYRDIFAFIFCFVMAGSQYSLLKSVQPDASSSTHGDDARYSRPIYFCLCASILIFSHHLSTSSTEQGDLTLFGIPYSTQGFFYYIQEFMSIILLLFPILFSFGLFAQVNTFLMYALEQLDMHIFGGNAVCSLVSGFLGVCRSLFACCMLYGFAFGGLSETRSTQHVLFSCFCALLVASSYHLSRNASDCTYLWAIIKSSFIIHHDEDEELRKATKLSKIEKSNAAKRKNENKTKSTKIENANKRQVDEHQASTNNSTEIEKETEASVAAYFGNSLGPKSIQAPGSSSFIEKEELVDPLPNKLKSTVNSRLKNDFLVCTVIGVIVFSLHSSTVFTALQPELNPILQGFVIVIGFILHYFIPQMRKYLPWLCFAMPILKQKEYGMYESNKAAKIMWFETTYLYLTFVERNILLPLVFISALTSDSVHIVEKFGIPTGSAIVVLCGLKSEYATKQILYRSRMLKCLNLKKKIYPRI